MKLICTGLRDNRYIADTAELGRIIHAVDPHLGVAIDEPSKGADLVASLQVIGRDAVDGGAGLRLFVACEPAVCAFG